MPHFGCIVLPFQVAEPLRRLGEFSKDLHQGLAVEAGSLASSAGVPG
ncbi:hypothetical protein [Aminivibrio sp.]